VTFGTGRPRKHVFIGIVVVIDVVPVRCISGLENRGVCDTPYDGLLCVCDECYLWSRSVATVSSEDDIDPGLQNRGVQKERVE
jgi:hypothetical protein